MKGFVPTPHHICDLMVEQMFRIRQPDEGCTILDPGCGDGRFLEAILRYIERHRLPRPKLVGIELDPQRAAEAAAKFRSHPSVRILTEDFLFHRGATYDFIIGNPPYVSITKLSTEEKELYRKNFATARGRFDLYVLFFEKALELLKARGLLAFITPEKFLYVESAKALRKQLAEVTLHDIFLMDEEIFQGFTTYPAISLFEKRQPKSQGRLTLRDGDVKSITLGEAAITPSNLTNSLGVSERGLASICTRISCGVATGADSIFVLPGDEVPANLQDFAVPTISGRQLNQPNAFEVRDRMLMPYKSDGTLRAETEMGALAKYLSEAGRLQKLLQRTCVTLNRKAWYAFHENPPLREIFQPKILCKDITAAPNFWADYDGVVPRHSVYYLVPSNPEAIVPLLEYLNSPPVRTWLLNNCQRASKGFIRMQSAVLKNLPLPEFL